jgi:hypothetical protein
MTRPVELAMSEGRLFGRRKLRAPGPSAQAAARVADVRSLLARGCPHQMGIAFNGLFGLSSYTYGTATRIRNCAKWCQAGVMPNGTANAPAAKTSGAAHIVDRCTRRSESTS